MILKDIYEHILPKIRGKKVTDVRIGVGLLCVELDNSSIGVSYVMRDELPSGCGILPVKERLAGMDAEKMAAWAFEEKNLLMKALGIAVLNAASDYCKSEKVDESGLFNVKDTDVVGMIGLIGPVANTLSKKVKQLIVFDRGLEGQSNIYPETRQGELLPKCDVVVITGTTILNDTLDFILECCTKAREVIVMGPSTPLYPEVFKNTKVTELAGTSWPHENKEDIFISIGEAGGVRQVSKFGNKLSIRIK